MGPQNHQSQQPTGSATAAHSGHKADAMFDAEALARLSAAGVATHVVRVAPPRKRAAGDDILTAAGLNTAELEHDMLTLATLCALCPGQVARIRPGLYALDAAEMDRDALTRLPMALSRRLFGPLSGDGVSIQALPTPAAEIIVRPEPEKAIDWAACEVRLEDVAADLGRRAATLSDDARRSRAAIETCAARAIDRVAARSEHAIDALERAAAPERLAIVAADAARAVEDRIAALLGRVTEQNAAVDLPAAEPAIEAREAVEAAPPQPDERAAINGALEVLQAVMSDMRARADVVDHVSQRLDALRAEMAEIRAETEAPTAPTPTPKRAASAPKAPQIASDVSPFGAFSLALGGAPILPGDQALQSIIADAMGAPGAGALARG